MAKKDDRGRVQSTGTSFEIIHTLQERGPSRLSEIADHLGMAESTTHRHLSTLCDLRYVSRQGERYQLGLRFVRLGQAARTRDADYAAAKPYVEDIAEETEERAQFVVEDHGLGVYLYQATGNRAVEVGTNIGRQIRLHCSSAGKTILAHYPRDRVHEILDRWGLPAYTEETITDRDELLAELDEIRERGYGFNREEHVEGIHAVAVPVERDGSILGVLSVSGPSHRLRGGRLETEVPDLLLATANELELNIAYAGADRPENHIVE